MTSRLCIVWPMIMAARAALPTALTLSLEACCLSNLHLLTGTTTKVRWPGSVHAYYVTVNVDQTGRPFELFVASKNVEGADLMVGMTRMVSAVMRRAGDLSFVVEELKAVADPKGGQWYNGRLVPSLLHVIGSIIEPHVTGVAVPVVKAEGATCPACGEHTLVHKDGCATCISCGHSACG